MAGKSWAAFGIYTTPHPAHWEEILKRTGAEDIATAGDACADYA